MTALRPALLVGCVACSLVAAPVAGADPGGPHPPGKGGGGPLRPRIVAISVDAGGGTLRALPRGRPLRFSVRYELRGSAEEPTAATVSVSVARQVWQLTVPPPAQGQMVGPGIWAWAATATLPATFPAGRYRLTAVVSLAGGRSVRRTLDVAVR
jgi:hypothetical protein